MALAAALILTLPAQATNDEKHTDGTRTVLASHYGKRSNGHKTASGERHHSDEHVCAHRTLPFGTKIRLHNPKTGKTITVKVNDRGPFCKNRTLDLSYGAARDLGFLGQGVAKLEMTVEE